MIDLTAFVTLSVSIFGAGAAVKVLPFWRPVERARISLGLALLGSLIVLAAAVGFWHRPPAVSPPLFSWIPAGGAGLTAAFDLDLTLYVDRLAVFFLFLTGLLSAAVTLYSWSWLRKIRDQDLIAGLLNLSILSLLLIIIVNNAFFFLVFLEFMTLVFSRLTLHKHFEAIAAGGSVAELNRTQRAFKVYWIANHIALVFILAAFLILAVKVNSFDFAEFRARPPDSDCNWIFGLALIGFGIKAGMFPFHLWLPLTHPYMPTNIHALMSGLIIKVSGIYGMLRVFFEFLPVGPWWWGRLILLLGGITALVGVFYAVISRDLKTALANHSIENIGIILMGIGLALVLRADRAIPIAISGLALVAALYHTLNHSVFKGLLFLCTGAIEDRTGTVEMEKLGGLFRRFPWTGTAFLIGALAIAGFPPLNGFSSEWLTLQLLIVELLAVQIHQNLWVAPVVVAALLLLSVALGVTVLAFAKIIGETLLGIPRSAAVLQRETPGEVPWTMRGVLGLLAGLCLLLGIWPGGVVQELGAAVCGLDRFASGCAAMARMAAMPEAVSVQVTVKGIPGPWHYEAYLSVIGWLIPIVVVVGLAGLLSALSRHRGRAARGAEWNGGPPIDPETMQIPGGTFSSRVWEIAGGTVVEPSESPEPGPLPERWFQSAQRYVRDDVGKFYNGILNRLLEGAEALGAWVQCGDIRRYLSYILVTFLMMLLILALVSQ